MARIVLLTDMEPVHPLANPIISLEQANAIPFDSAISSAIRNIGRTEITRLQYIETKMIHDDIRKWTEEREYGEMGIPSQLAADYDHWYVPDYLRGKIRYKYAEDDELDPG